MYEWIKVHQSRGTGLVISFEGDNDIAGWAFIYDQALTANAFLLFDDTEAARKILNFFSREMKDDFKGFTK